MILSTLQASEVAGLYSTAEMANLALRLGLSGITLASGVGKLVDPEGSSQAIGDFGLPSRWVGFFAIALPLAECLAGLALLSDATSPSASLALAAMFCAFGVGIANLLRQDKAPPCNCFGAIHSEPVSKFTLLRVTVLAALALVCYNLPVFPLVRGWAGFAILVPTYLLAGLGVKKWARKKLKDKTYRRLGVGQRIPSVRLRNGSWLQNALPDAKKSLLFLTAPDCCPCAQLKGTFSQWAPLLGEHLPVVELVALVKDQELNPIDGITSYGIDRNSFRRFLCPTPGAILVDRNGTILEPPVSGAEQIEALIRLSLRADESASEGNFS